MTKTTPEHQKHCRAPQGFVCCCVATILTKREMKELGKPTYEDGFMAGLEEAKKIAVGFMEMWRPQAQDGQLQRGRVSACDNIIYAIKVFRGEL